MRIALQAALGLGRSSVSARGDKVEFELYSITVTESNNKLYWLEGTPGLFARFVAMIPPGNYTFEGLLIRVRDRVNYARGGSTALMVTGVGGQLQFQYLTGFVLKIPTAAELANPTWKAANWDAAIVPVGEGQPFKLYHAQLLQLAHDAPRDPRQPSCGCPDLPERCRSRARWTTGLGRRSTAAIHRPSTPISRRPGTARPC
jgi:hypothetical protein